MNQAGKYKAVRTEVDGHTFASRKEAARYEVLRDLERSGEIQELTLQPRFPLRVNGQLICTYIADFRYCQARDRCVVEDVKGFKTREYRIKRKLMKALHDIDVLEV